MSDGAPRALAAGSAAQIEALFAPLARARGVLLAVSGGPDSTALMILSARWAAQGARPPIAAATVDHGLREGARAEAGMAAALAARLGLPHHILEWRGPRPRSRIQERARQARYGLLGACARAIGADFLVTAHHADDQAETVLFRLLRGSGIGGLRGMAPAAALDGLTLARPLLGASKRELVAICEAAGAAYADDPSNSDPRFARTQVRRLTAVLAAEGLGATEIARLARRAGQMEEAVVAQTRAAAARLGWNEPRATRDARALLAEPIEIAQRLLAGEIARVAGRPARQLRLEAIENLTRALAEAQARGEALRANVGGASVHLSAGGALGVSPEAPRRSGATPPAQATDRPAPPGA
ncbi:MAG: tRNA lysidine(34) synthetase TilS [Roseiarcus sp.]